jgi:predicted RNA methylase
MRSSLGVISGLLLLGALLVAREHQLHGRALDGKEIKLKLLLPLVDCKLTVDGKDFTGDGKERLLNVTTVADKDYVLVVATLVPNNYTTITRPRKVVAKEGEVVVDLRQPSDTEKDDIVVRFVPTPDDVVAAMCKAAKVGKDDVVYDLGCGDGRMVITAVKDFAAKRGVGIDLDPELVKKCKNAANDAGVAEKVQFRVGDVLKVEDMSDASVVLLYMGDDINARLKPILQKTLKPGSRVVSHRFLMGEDWKPDHTETIHSSAGYDCLVHLWEIKKKQ